MKQIISCLTVFALLSFSSFSGPEYCRADKKFALKYMKSTRERLLNDVKGLSDTQLNYKMTDSSWTIANCMEHIAISEKNLYDMTMPVINGKLDPARRAEVKYDDEQIMQMITNRGFKAKAPEGFKPTNQFGSFEGSVKAFTDRRTNTMNFIKSNKKDLRNLYMDHPFLGTIDSYQMFLFLTGHTLRHTLQIEEIKAHSGFPAQ